MPAKSFIGEIEHAAREFYATAMRGEVSDANVRGYLRAASQIEDIWQQTADKVTALIAGGATPWDAYYQARYPLAFIRAARSYQVFVSELLAADAAADPATAGYLPRVTYDQANALCHQIQPNIEQAVAALNDATYLPTMTLPLALGPRIEPEGHVCPVPHLLGMLSAAHEMREWAAGLIAEYTNAVGQAKTSAPASVMSHIATLNSRLAEADSQLRFGQDLVGQVTEAGATRELHEEAENNLWSGINAIVLLNQAVAMPEALQPNTTPQTAPSQRKTYRDKRISPGELWRVAAPSARAELRGTKFGDDELEELCGKMGGVLSAGAQQYLDEVDAAVARGDAQIIAAMANCPFEPLYRAKCALELAGAQVPAGYEFHWNFHEGHLESAARFGRANDWQECEE